jgi:hypothetical protein
VVLLLVSGHRAYCKLGLRPLLPLPRPSQVGSMSTPASTAGSVLEWQVTVRAATNGYICSFFYNMSLKMKIHPMLVLNTYAIVCSRKRVGVEIGCIALTAF